MYTWCIHLMPTKGVLKKGGKHKIQLHSSYIKLSQSTKSILDKELSSMYINDLLLFLSIKKNDLLLFFLLQCPKQSQRGHLQDFFYFYFFSPFFCMKASCQLKRFFLIVECITQTIPKREKTGCHRILTLGQWRSR